MLFDIHCLPLKILHTPRKTLSLEITPDGLLVRAPRHMTRGQIDTFLAEKRSWIEKHWRIMQERQAALNQLPPFTMEELRALAEKASVVIPERVKHYAPLIGVDYGRITIRNQRTRWGSCSDKGNLNFNCLLMLLPDDVIDSVVVHELCHRKHMNHSPQFYAEIEKVFPEYQRCRRWLRENGSVYLSRLP
ncbi:MAG: M48 family metallopeptidase [Lachnospiraceae bacterium]|nr:M48 family metallopeptidase [Lachnospiraceae bacterium]